MKHLFTMQDLTETADHVDENTQVLLQGQPFSDQVKVFVEVGTLAKSKDLAERMGASIHGRRWGKITRNDGHYIEVETEEHEDDTAGGKDATT